MVLKLYRDNNQVQNCSKEKLRDLKLYVPNLRTHENLSFRLQIPLVAANKTF